MRGFSMAMTTITAADDPLSAATDLAEHLVETGTPFREAHAIVHHRQMLKPFL